MGHDLRGRSTGSVVLGGNIDVLNNARLRTGDLVVNGSISAVGDVDMRTRGLDLGGLTVSGSIEADDDVRLRQRGGGRMQLSGHVASLFGNTYVRVIGGGEVVVTGTVESAADINIRTRGGEGDVVLGGSLTAGGDIEIRGKKGTLRCFRMDMVGDASANFIATFKGSGCADLRRWRRRDRRDRQPHHPRDRRVLGWVGEAERRCGRDLDLRRRQRRAHVRLREPIARRMTIPGAPC